MPEVISNTSCLIALDNVGRLPLLKDLYGRILITEEVAQEFGQPLSYDWITIQAPENREYIRILELTVDLGEASTIALAIEKSGSVPILDDVKARKLAERLQLNFTGLLGVLLKAKQQDLISTVADLLTELKSAGFRIAADVEQETLRLAGEEE